MCQSTISQQCLDEKGGDEELCLVMLVTQSLNAGRSTGFVWTPGAIAGVAVTGDLRHDAGCPHADSNDSMFEVGNMTCRGWVCCRPAILLCVSGDDYDGRVICCVMHFTCKTAANGNDCHLQIAALQLPSW